MPNSERFRVSFLYYLLLKVLILRDFSHFSVKLHHQFSPIAFCRPSKNPVFTVLSKVFKIGDTLVKAICILSHFNKIDQYRLDIPMILAHVKRLFSLTNWKLPTGPSSCTSVHEASLALKSSVNSDLLFSLTSIIQNLFKSIGFSTGNHHC